MLVMAAKLLSSLYSFSIGFYFLSSNPLLLGLGISFAGFGRVLLIISSISFVFLIPQMYAMKRHNRFLLVICMVIDISVATQLVAVSSDVGNYTTPAFPKALQLDCLLTVPLYHKPSKCAEYYQSEKVAGYRLFWFGFYSNSNDNQVVFQLENTGCCGFFAPLKCRNDSRPFPNQFSTKGVSSEFLSSRVQCGPGLNYYPEESDCVDYSNPNVQPPIIGGCIYDHGVGSCLTNTQYQYVSGCASAVEDYLISAILPHVYLFLVAMSFCLLSALASCCMFLKRKESDVFPELLGDNHVRASFFLLH